MRLFDENKPFFKGNLHCHTTRSDGRLDPSEVKAFYRERGYDFLALTDHRIVSEQPAVENGLLMLPGVEWDYAIPGESIHIVGFGMNAEYARQVGYLETPQGCIDAINQYDGRAILCHPAWSLNSPETIGSFTGLIAAEIYNSTSTYPWNGDRADSSLLLDIAATQGAMLNYVASDDSHAYNGEAGRSATMVQAASLSRDDILAAMDAGRFYCTQGPRFEQLQVDGDTLTVRCSPVKYVIFYSNHVWADHRCVSGEGMTAASYRLHAQPDERFVRVQLIDERGDSAWSNPIKLI